MPSLRFEKSFSSVEGLKFCLGSWAGRVVDKPVGTPLLVGGFLVSDFDDVARF